jgi:4-amino-4-deoxy-L-arabinose transferase-like glycosyltransferase
MTSHNSGPVTERLHRVFRAIPRIADCLIYAGIVFSSVLSALFGAYRTDADTVAYLDLSDAIKDHNWHSAINANWFPFYPSLLTVGRAVFGFRVQYEFMAARLVDAVLGLAFVAAAVALAASVQRLMLARGIDADNLLPARTLYVWTALVAYFFASLDLNNIKPDTLVSTFMILAVAALLRALAEDSLLAWAAVGLCGGLAYWAKAFAFPFFLLLIFLAALVYFRKARILARLVLALLVFVVIAAPLLWQISTLRGRFTIGEAGRLDMAWYVNHADRFNPLADPATWQPGTAVANFKHPGELLSKTPSISYYGGPHSFGSTPQWTDVSYWSDGLAPRFVWSQSLAEIKYDLTLLGATLVMRFQVVLFAVMLVCWGFRVRKESFADRIVLVVLVLAVACVGLYSVVYLETRYVVFALVMIVTVYAACSLTRMPARENRSLHAAVLVMAALVLLFGLQSTLREWKASREQGAHPWRGIYSAPIFSAGAALGRLYPRGAEVACMGDAACWDDPYWVRYAGLRMTAIIETGHGSAEESAEQGCVMLAENPAALNAMRSKNIRAIVARFDGTQPCSAAWQPLGTSHSFFYLPL